MTRTLSIVAMALCVAVHVAGCTSTTAVVDDLGSLGGDSLGLGINNAGNVTGASFGSPGQPHSGLRAFRYTDSLGMSDIGVLPGGEVCEGQGISGRGVVAGACLVARFGDLVPRAFLASPALAPIDLGTLGGDDSYAWDVNDLGQVTGEASTAIASGGGSHAFLWTSAGGMTDIGTLGGSVSVGRSINAKGQVAGDSQTRNNRTTHAFRFTPGAGLIDLGTLGGNYSSGYGINDGGQVVGESLTDLVLNPEFLLRGTRFRGTYAFLWTEGVGMVGLGSLGGGYSSARAVNNHGVVVGTSTLTNGTQHAFRWTSRGGMVDLNTLLPRTSGWVLHTAWDVNDRGQITGEGAHNGRGRAFRLSPTPVRPDEALQ